MDKVVEIQALVRDVAVIGTDSVRARLYFHEPLMQRQCRVAVDLCQRHPL